MDLTNSMNLSSMSKKIKILMPIVGAAVITLGTLGKAQALSFLSTSTGIGTIDTSTGIFTPFISSGPTFTDIALSNDNNLFGITFTELYSIDQSTGSSSLIGNLGRGGFNNALGFAFSDDNQLFGAGDSDFYTINTSTGATSLVADIPGFFSSGDIVFDPVNDRFLATSSFFDTTTLFSISRNGTATQIGNIGFSYVFGLFFEHGTLFGYTGYGYGQQLTIDLTTGAGTFDKNVTGVTGEILGATSLPSTGPARPVPDTGSVLGLLTVGAFGAVSALKRKQRQKV